MQMTIEFTERVIRRHPEKGEGIVYLIRNYEVSHRRRGLAPRCRLIASWG